MWFSMHQGWQCIDPNELPDAGLGNAPKAALLGLGKGMHAFFYLISSLQCVGKRVAWIQELWQCIVMLAFMGRMLGQVMPLKVHRLALAYTNICLFVVSFIVFVRSTFLGKEMGGVLVFALCCGVCLAR